jgi:hypothetical protein
MAPMWSFWWIFPVLGLVICALFLVAMVRAIIGGGGFMCMGPREPAGEETARLRREVEDLRAQLKKQSA